jgi:hypothetical protein
MSVTICIREFTVSPQGARQDVTLGDSGGAEKPPGKSGSANYRFGDTHIVFRFWSFPYYGQT